MVRLVLLAVLALAAVAQATTLLRADVPTLTDHADVIVQGRVLSRASHWTPDHRRIVTDVRIQVEEALKGEPARELTIRQPGGVVGGIGQRVSGLASFREGEEVLVFLERSGPVHRVAGMAQGKYSLERSASGAIQAVPAPLGDAQVVDPASRAPLSLARSPVALKTLKAQIAQALKRKAPARR
jgi:hypothetical protein